MMASKPTLALALGIVDSQASHSFTRPCKPSDMLHGYGGTLRCLQPSINVPFKMHAFTSGITAQEGTEELGR